MKILKTIADKGGLNIVIPKTIDNDVMQQKILQALTQQLEVKLML